MVQNEGQTELRGKTQALLDGPLKHIRAAALAAALLPLASIAAAPASAQSVCASGGVCGTVFNDANNNGIQDAGETGIEGVKVFVCQLCDGTDTIAGETGPGGTYSIFVPGGDTTVSVLIPTGMVASPPNVGSDAFDSDGIPDGGGFSVAAGVPADGTATDFGFFTLPVQQPGTGTPGYWKNHPEAWPVSSITVGGLTYTKAQAIAYDPLIWSDLGVLYAEQHRDELGIEMLRRAISEGSPGQRRARVRANLAELQWKHGDREGAKTGFQRALDEMQSSVGRNHPDVAAILEKYSQVLKRSGLKAEAQDAADRAARIHAAFDFQTNRNGLTTDWRDDIRPPER